MTVEKIETLIVGGGQAGLAMSEHLRQARDAASHCRAASDSRALALGTMGISSVANGPAWHDRFPDRTFSDVDPDAFAPASKIVEYFVAYADQIAAPIRCGVEVKTLRRNADGSGFRAETSTGVIDAANVVAATGPFQRPIIPAVVPADLPGLRRFTPAPTAIPRNCPRGRSW